MCCYRFERILRSLLFVLVTAAGWAAETNTLVIPAEQTSDWGHGGGGLFGRRFQQIYSPSEFAAASSDIMNITAIAFRWPQSFNSQQTNTRIRLIQLWAGVTAVPTNNFAANLPAPFEVYSGRDINLPISTNRLPTTFDLVFKFNKPFLYDRRHGWFVLEGATTSDAPSDVDYIADQRGFYAYLEYFGGVETTRVVAHLMVTKFFYQGVPEVLRITYAAESVTVHFLAPESSLIVVESSDHPEGPYSPLDDLEITAVGGGIYSVRIGWRTVNQYFRVGVN